jgi:hypothetical protein
VGVHGPFRRENILYQRIIIGYMVLGPGKCEDARSISKREHDEFYHGSGPLESNNTTSSLAILLSGF